MILILIAAVVGGLIVLGVQYLTVMPKVATPAAPAPAAGETLPAGSILLAKDAASCPAGWAANGAVAINTSADYTLGASQKRSNPGIFTTETDGFQNVIFALCVKG